MENEYLTGQIAEILHIHPNSVRWYDNVGLISPARRTKKGYRKFNNGHLIQLRILKVILRGKYSNKMIRNSAFAILTALKEKERPDALKKALEYKKYLQKEYSSASRAVKILTSWMNGDIAYSSAATMYSRKEAAQQVDVTVEVLRNWERNGLISVSRTGKKNERIYSETDIIRMRLIHMLRQNNYSIAAIHNSLTLYDKGDIKGAASALNSPYEDPERVYLLAGDHWLEVLEKLLVDAEEMIAIIHFQNHK